MSNEKPLTKDQQVVKTAQALQARYGFNTPSGRTRALYEGTKHDDIMFSKRYKDTLLQSKRDGLISAKDAQRIGSYMAERAVELANSGQAGGFTPEGEFKPWVSRADMRKQRQAAKAQYGEDMEQVAAADRAQMAASGYRPEDLQNQGYRLPEGTPFASGYEMPITGAGFAQDPMREMGIYGQQVAQGITGMGQGLMQGPQALGARMMGQDPSAVVQEGTPGFEAGQVTGQRLGASAAALPITVPAMTGGGAVGSAIGGGIGSLFGPGGRVAGQVIGGFLGGAAGAYGGHAAANYVGTGAMNMLLGQAANAKLQQKQNEMANKYPLAARYGESALEVSMFAPRIMPEGFSPKLAAAGFKQSGMRGLREGITDQGAFLNSFVEGGGEGALALWQAKQQSDREKELGMPGKSAMDILAEGAFGALFQKETKFGKKVFGTLSGRDFMANRANAQPQFSPTSVEGIAGQSATRPSTGVDNATMTPEGWRRINLGGRIKGGLDAEGNPIVSGARYAVYNPTDRKAYIYTDNDFALTGERTRNAAFNLTVADKLFKHNPIMGYKDSVDGVQRMILGITRDAGVRVRDINDDLSSTIKVVPLSDIRDTKIAKRIDEVMQEQGVLANKAPAPHTPEAFMNADKVAFPDEVTIDESGPIAARVVSQIGRKDSNMFVVALPDGSHIRLNGGSINVGKPGSILVRGKLSESLFPTSLADLVAPKGGLENLAFVKDGEQFHHLQLTPEQKSIYSQVKRKFSADIRAAKDEPDDARREAMIGIVKNKIGEEFARVATIPPPSGKFKDADVIDITLEQPKFKGVPQTAIVVGRNKFGYQVRLVDHTDIGEFTVPEALIAGYDPSMGMPDSETNFEGTTAEGAMPKSAMPGPGTVPLGQPLGPGKKAEDNTSTVRRGEQLTVEADPNADNVDYHELPNAVRSRIDQTLAKHGDHIKRLGIGNSITINQNTADAIHDITIKRVDPTSWQYTMRTSEVDPKTRAVSKQYVSDYTLSVDEKTGDIVATIGKPTNEGQQGQQTPTEIKTEADAAKVLKATEFVGRHQVRFLDMPVQMFKMKPDGTGFLFDSNKKPIVDSTLVHTPIYDHNGRKIVVANINGVRVPFYLSTGAAGKKTVASGKWYPFFGIARSDDSPGGWLNKGSEAAINAYYGSSHLKEVAQHLDSILGDVRDLKTTKSFSFRADRTNKVIDFINQGLNPTENKKSTTASDFAANVKNVIDALESASPGVVGGQTVMAYQTDSEAEAGQPSTPQFEPGSTTRGRAAMGRRYVLGRVKLSDAFEYKRLRTAIEQDPGLSQADKEKQIIALEKQFKETLDNIIKQGLFNLNRLTTQANLPEGMKATGSREERYGYKVKSKEGNDLTQLQYAETDRVGINDKEVIQTAVKMGKDTFLLNAIRVNNKRQLATVLSEQYKVNSQVASFISDIVDRFARGWALDKVNAQIGRAHDLFESTGRLQEHLAKRKPGEYADTRGMYFRQFARTEPEVNKAVSEFMREFYRERFAAFAVLDQATGYDSKYKGAIFKAVKDNNTAFNVIVGFASRDISTAIHEIGHALLRGMSDENKALVVERFHHANRFKDNKVPLDVEEAWAGAFEAALMSGQFPQNYAAQKAFRNEDFKQNRRLLYDPVLQKTWEEVGDYLNGVRNIVIKKRDKDGLPTNAEYRAGKVFWEAPYKNTERLFKGMSIEVMMPGGVKEFGVVMKAQQQPGLPVQVQMTSGRIEEVTPSQITRIAGWTDGFNNAVLDLVANMTRQNYSQHIKEVQASNPEFFEGFSNAKPTITGSYDTKLATSPRNIAFQTSVENELNQAGWFASQKDIDSIKKHVSGLLSSGRVVLNAEGKVEQVLDQRGKPSFAYSVLQTVNGYTPETALAMYAITETPEFRKWSGGKPLVEAVYNTDVRANMPVEKLMPEERIMIRQMMAGIDLLKALKAAYRGDRSDDLIGDIEVLSKDYYGYDTPESKKAAEMAEFYTSDTDESNVALAGLISALDYEINKSTRFDLVRNLTQSSIDYRSAMRKPRTGTGFVTMAFHPNDSHAWLPREGGYIIPSGVGEVDGVGRGGAYIRVNNPLVVDLKNNGMAIDRVAKYKEQAKATGRDSVVLLNVRHSIGGASTLHNMVIPMNDHPLRVMDSMGKVNLSTFFSGGGLIEAGSKDVATPIKAVEFDKKVASVYRSNHGDHIEVGDVRNVDIASMLGTEWFHASPVCKNYSIASTAKTESNEDITTAKAVVDVVDRVQPPVVTIENVKQYEGTEAFNMIIDALNRNGYNHQTAVYKTSDFAGSTMRERLLIRATRGFALPPITQNKLYKAKSWYEAVEDLIDDMPIGQLTQQQVKQFVDRGIDIAKIDQPYLVQSTSKGAPQKMYGPAYTVMAGTGQAMRIVLPGGIVKVVTDRALARWQGLPDSYVLPEMHTLANKVVGNGVPTELTKYVLSPVAEAYMKHKAKQAATTAMSETEMAFQSVDNMDMPSQPVGKAVYAKFDPSMYGDAQTVTGKKLSDKADFVQKSAALADIRPGQIIATRLNISFLTDYKVPIQAVHQTTPNSARPYDGKVIAYSHAITVNNPSFVVNQEAVHQISSGNKAKFPMAAVVGEYVPTPVDKHRIDGEVLRFNPKDTHLFTDSQGNPVKAVRGKVTSYGTKVYVHPGSQIEYWGADAPQRYKPDTEMAFQSSGEAEMAFQTPYDPGMPMGNRVYTQPASPGAPSTVTRIMPRSSPSGYGRWWAAVDFLNDITRMVLSGDLAFTTLQAGIIGLSNPKLGLQAMLAGLKGFAPNMQIEVNGQKIGSRKLGREVYHQVGNQMRANPAYNIAREAGLKLQMFEIDQRFNDMREVELANLRNQDPTATIDDCKTTLMDVDELGTNDEWYMKNRITRHLPGQGQFERYNSILHDTILLTQFDNWYKTLLSMGYEPGSEKFNKAMQDTARILNVSIGDIEYSTDATRDAAASRIAKVMFTAPRWLMSRALIDPMINTILSNSSWVRDVMGQDNPVFDLYKSGKVDPEVRKLGISMWLRVAGAQIAMMLMAILYQNWNPDVEANADRSFGRIRIGDVRFDPPAGIFDHYRLGIRMYQALLSTDPKNVQKAEKAGVPLWYYQFEDLRKEMQYKSSPLVNTVVAMFGGNDPAAMFNGIEGLKEAQAKSVVGEPYYGTNEPATFFYDSFLRPRVAELFGKQVADNGGFSNAFIERLPTVFPQFMDAYYRAYEYDRPPLAYALANMIPNFLGFKVEVTPAEYLKDRVKNRNEEYDSPNILKLLSEGGALKSITGQ